MDTGPKCISDELVERHIMIAVDESDNAKRAVLFVGDFFGCYPSIRVTLLNIILEPASGFFEKDDDLDAWKKEKLEQAEQVLADYRRLLIDSGFPEDMVEARVEVMQGTSVADCIIEEQEQMKCCSVVIGRRGISKKEEFIFGSTSNKILHNAKNCAVMVIE